MQHTQAGGPSVEELLRQILEFVGEDAVLTALPPGEVDADSVVLDITIDGQRYVLVREHGHTLPRVSLSPREREIVRLVARGLPNKAIADVLDISLWTVATYLRRLFAKLTVSSRAELVAKAYNEGLLS